MGKTEYLNLGADDCCKRGRRLTRDGRHSEAIEALNQAIAKDPAHAEAYFVRGGCHYAQGRYDWAADDMNAAAIFGYRDAQFWSKHSIRPFSNSSDDRQE